MSMEVIVGPVIQAGESLSAPVNVSTGGVYRIIMPDEWEGVAPITFQLSYNGTDFYNVYDIGGTEISARCIQQSVVPLGSYLYYIQSMKIRSGTQRQPVVQNAMRTFKLVLDTKSPFVEPAKEQS